MNSCEAADYGDGLLHGWDAREQSWHGPVSLDSGGSGTRSALARMKNARGAFHFGKFRCSVPGLPSMEFHTAVYDRQYAGLAIVHLDGPRGGPIAVVAVLPASRRELLHTDFPLELMTLVSMLSSPVNRGCEIAIHDYIEESLKKEPQATHVFTLGTSWLDDDAAIVLSAHQERLAAAMLAWLAERNPAEDLIPSAFDTVCAPPRYDAPAA